MASADLINKNTAQHVPLGYRLNDDGSYALLVSVVNPSSGGGGGEPGEAGPDREIAVTQYRAKNNFTGATAGDTITSIRVLDVTGAGITQVGSTVWYNETTQATLAAAPASANLEPLATGGLTNAQMVAALSGISKTDDIATLAQGIAAGNADLSAKLSSILAKLFAPGGSNMAGSMPVTLASDDAQIGAPITGLAAMPAGGSGLIGWLSRIWDETRLFAQKLPASLGAKSSATSLSVTPSTDGVFSTRRPSRAVTNRSGATNATASTATNIIQANASREGFAIQNNSTSDIWISLTGTATFGAGSFVLKAGGGYFESPPGGGGVGAVSAICAVAAAPFTAMEW